MPEQMHTKKILSTELLEQPNRSLVILFLVIKFLKIITKTNDSNFTKSKNWFDLNSAKLRNKKKAKTAKE